LYELIYIVELLPIDATVPPELKYPVSYAVL